MTWADWQPILVPIFGVVGLGIAGWMVALGNVAIAAFERRTGVMLTDQQRAAVHASMTTAAGLLQKQLDLGILRPADITPTSPAVVEAAAAAIARVADSAAAEKTTPMAAAEIVASRVITAPTIVVKTP